MKIRGSAQQIADKYATLARDSQTSGDRVMAENYLQHAEHYNRIIAAAQAQMPIQQVRDNRDDSDEDQDDEPEASGAGGSPDQRRGPANDGTGPQPVIEGTPAEVAYKHGSEHNAESDPVQGSADSGENGRDREQRANGGHAHDPEASGPENEDSPVRRPRRPRRKANGRGDEAAPSNGAAHAEDGLAAGESPSSPDDGGGAAEPAN